MGSDKPFANFLSAFGATKILLERAKQNEFFIEALILYSALVDGLCRIALILKEQLDNDNSEINLEYIQQIDGTYGMSERSIYKQSHDKKILNNILFKEINGLYDFRNKLIHRFFLSKIDYSKTKSYLNDYKKVYNSLRKVVSDLETEQIKLNVGMTRSGRHMPNVDKKYKTNVLRKIGLFNNDIVHSLGFSTVEEVMEFSRNQRLMDKCKKCNHYKMIHINTEDLKTKRSDVKGIEKLLNKCTEKGCLCKKFVNN